ncbi:anoctamin-4-like [Tubulanus polymorphus]|uniref:anoctamin-4-like n=1 Tax=Tubulanus polymorphus TaxID=672921 RepID=UPI003DA2E48B
MTTEDKPSDKEEVTTALVGTRSTANNEGKNLDTLHSDIPEGRNLFFDEDPTCRIDFVLAYNPVKKNGDRLETIRQTFEENLRKEGLKLEYWRVEGKLQHFVKIHAPWEVLSRYAEIMKIRMPMKDIPGGNTHMPMSWWEQFLGLGKKLTDLFQVNRKILPPLTRRFTCIYSRDKEYLFAIPEPKELFFKNTIRSRIVDYILRRKEFTNDVNDAYSFGIKRLIKDDVYEAAFPLHEGGWKPGKSKPNMRKHLYDQWAAWRNAFKSQPLDYIRNYFGEKIALYFAWLGFYTYMLVPASIVGVIVFMYGLMTISSNEVTKDICGKNSANIVMCPLCDRRCAYWNLTDACAHMRASHLFDNGATFFFAIFMSIWGTIFLEFWKRTEADIQFRWSLMNFESEEEPARPEYLGSHGRFITKKKHFISGIDEPHMPFWRVRVPVFVMSFSVMLLLVTVAIGCVVGVITYRAAVRAALFATDTEFVYTHASIITSVTAACINLAIICVLRLVYNILAVKLTDMEHLRTQSDYDDSLTLKLYMLQFVNYYSSLFYIAFFKGKFAGRPGNYTRIFNSRQESCMGGGCLIELCIQLAIIMVGKQLIQSVVMEYYAPRLIVLIKKWYYKIEKETKQHWTPWEKDSIKAELGPQGVFHEYLEMLIQFGFLTIFVAAFPLAPLFALINNVVEIRGDAQKFVTRLRRPVAYKKQNIGIWFSVLSGLSRIAVLSNALIIAFTSDFIPRVVFTSYYSQTGDLKGYINSTLSIFDTEDFENASIPADYFVQQKSCRYRGYHNPPWHKNKYEYTEKFWHILAARVLFVVCFQNFCYAITSMIAWIIPDVPQKLKLMMRRETYITNEIILKTELKRAHGIDVSSSDNYPLSDDRIRAISTAAAVLMNSRNHQPPPHAQENGDTDAETHV